MQYVSDKPTRTVRGRVVYDRKLHPFNKASITRITRHFVEDNKGWVETELLPFFYEISNLLLEGILAALALPPALARSILDFLVEQANKVMMFLFGLGEEQMLRSLAWRNFQWLCEPYMSNDQLAALGRYLKDNYGIPV